MLTFLEKKAAKRSFRALRKIDAVSRQTKHISPAHPDHFILFAYKAASEKDQEVNPFAVPSRWR